VAPPAANLDEYAAALSGTVLHIRGDRGLIEITGKDRAAWLHNLVTNEVKKLQPGEGNYAFAVNIKGRCIFDCNILVDSERMLLDVDNRWIDTAIKHLTKYTITEDVTLKNISAAFGRVAIMGPGATAVVGRLCGANLTPMAQLQHVAAKIAEADVRLIRHDIAGLPTAELIVPVEAMNGVTAAIDANAPLPRIGDETVRTIRIEAGIPASLDDIDEDVVPPETMQIERGISYHKGCYLGQEVIERMRSHGVLPRKLIGIRFESDAHPPRNATVSVDGAAIGRVTSSTYSPAISATLALGYVKSAHAQPGKAITATAGGESWTGQIVSLPVRAKSSV
jgi:tRNA-modifying protein YgfZ